MLRYIFPVRLRQWLGPLLVAGGSAALVGVGLIVSGLIDLTATTPHPQGWARFLHYVFRRSTAHHAAGIAVPTDLDQPIRVAAGAIYYGQACAHCHGAPGLGQNPVALSMTPRPQYLPHEASRFSPAQLFWIVRHGVKYSAMPGWPAEGRDDEVWHLVAYLRAQPRLSADQFRAMALAQPSTDVAVTQRFGPTPPLRPYRMRGAEGPIGATYAYATPNFGFESFALTDEPIRTCARCHGSDGGGGGVFPNLAIQDRTYLADSLRAFANGSRRSGYIQVVASQLSSAQIDALAGYYAGQPRRRTEPLGSASQPLVGRQLALVGDRSRGLGPCAGCHGITRAVGKAVPRLEGQSRWYLANQLHLFATGGRGGAATDVRAMEVIAHKLTTAEIEALAGWYAAQPPVAVQRFAATP